MSKYKITDKEAHRSLNDIVDFYIEDDFEGKTTMSVERLREYIKQQETYKKKVKRFLELLNEGCYPAEPKTDEVYIEMLKLEKELKGGK